MNCKVKAKVDNLTVADRTLMKGETGDCPVDRAKYLSQRNLVEVLGEGDEAKAAKGDSTERAVSPSARTAETQVKKG